MHSEYKSDVVILQETTKESIQPRLIHSAIGRDFSCWVDIPAIGVAEGILMAWNPAVIKEDELIGNFSIYVRFVEINSGFKWLLWALYTL